MLSRRTPAVALAAVLACALWVTGPLASATPTPTATPSPTTSVATDPWSALAPARTTSDDSVVTALVAQLGTAQAALSAATQSAEQAEQRAALAHQELQLAQQAAIDARAQAVQAKADLESATDTLRQVALADYMGGSSNSISILLSVTDPERLAEAEAVHTHLADAKAIVIAQATGAQRRFVSLSAEAELAAQQAEAADAQATAAQNGALAQQAAAKKQTDDLSAAVAAAKLTQQQDVAVLAGLSGGFGSQPLTPEQQAGYAQQAAQASLQLAATAAGSTKATTKARTWTPAIGQAAAYRALSQLLTPYSFGGGNAAGPTLGINSAGGGEHDASIKGYDCSGLALYAWAPYLQLAHDAATQYATAGTVHPTPDTLLAGDLIFWSSDATPAGIHHVAVYLGAGLVVQAPQSGDVVRVTSMSAVASGIFGATRPLS